MIMERLRVFYEKSRITFTFLFIMIVYFIFITLNGGTTDAENLVRYGAMYGPFVLDRKSVV